ncbi:MAG: signal peptidase I [Alphaproteobacteria bacterium]|nr:signal peptidase I [Alphaproteobacteria bacterium]
MKAKLLKLSLGLGTLFLLCWGVTSQTKLRKCVSESLEGIQYVLFLKSTSFKRGDIVLISNHPISYVREKPLAKRVLGFPGDRIVWDKEKLKIESKNAESQITLSTILPLLDKTKEDQPLTPLSVAIVPEGYLFVAGDHLRSFDSRYKEFGLVSIDKIWGKAICTW